MTKDTEMKIGVTFDKIVEVFKGTWHVAGLLFWLIWTIASYKASLDSHLKNIDSHMLQEDKKLQWIINHTGQQVPPDFEPQKASPKPESWYILPKIAEDVPRQDATIPLHP